MATKKAVKMDRLYGLLYGVKTTDLINAATELQKFYSDDTNICNGVTLKFLFDFAQRQKVKKETTIIHISYLTSLNLLWRQKGKKK